MSLKTNLIMGRNRLLITTATIKILLSPLGDKDAFKIINNLQVLRQISCLFLNFFFLPERRFLIILHIFIIFSGLLEKFCTTSK